VTRSSVRMGCSNAQVVKRGEAQVVRGLDYCGCGKRNIGRRKCASKIQVELAVILVKVDRRFSGWQREGLGLWKRNVKNGREVVCGSVSTRYRCLGAGSTHVHVRCRWNI
jgi:hypothetical protein